MSIRSGTTRCQIRNRAGARRRTERCRTVALFFEHPFCSAEMFVRSCQSGFRTLNMSFLPCDQIENCEFACRHGKLLCRCTQYENFTFEIAIKPNTLFRVSDNRIATYFDLKMRRRRLVKLIPRIVIGVSTIFRPPPMLPIVFRFCFRNPAPHITPPLYGVRSTFEPCGQRRFP